MSKAKSFHRSLYFNFFDLNKIDSSSSELLAKKKSKKDFESDFLILDKILNSMIYFDDLSEYSLEFLGDLSFYLPIYCSLLVKDFNDFKSLRASNFDLSFFFSKYKFEEILLL
jgi:hypothetical protein